MPEGAWLAVAVLLIAGLSVALGALLVQRKRRWEGTRQLNLRIGSLESALAQTERTLAECESGMSITAGPDRWLRTVLESAHPPLTDAAISDREKVAWLRHWVYETIPHCKYGQGLDPLVDDIVHKPAAVVLKELIAQRAGFQCGGTAWMLFRLYEIFGYPACTYNMGAEEGNDPSHMLTVVEIREESGPLWSVQDPYFDFTLEDESGRPLDVRHALERISLGRVDQVQIRETATPKSILVLPSNLEAIGKLEASGARTFDSYGLHRRYFHSHPLSVFRSWHPEAFREIQERFGRDFFLMLLFLPLNVHGDKRFQELFAFAKEMNQRYQSSRLAVSDTTPRQ